MLLSSVDYVVVGAGLAGLRAALDLERSGASVQVYEARSRVGGRTLTAPSAMSAPEDLALDMGAQWIGPGQPVIMELVSQLGLHTEESSYPGRSSWAFDGKIRRARGSIPPLPPLALADLVYNGVKLLSMRRDVPSGAPWSARRAAEWDGLDLATWADQHFHTAAAKNILSILVTGNLAVETRDVSLLAFLADLASTGSWKESQSAEKYRITEGTQEISVRLARQLVGEIIHEPVVGIDQEDDGVTVRGVSNHTRCRRVAVSVPPPMAASLDFRPELPPEHVQLLEHMPLGSSIKVQAVYERPFWRDAGFNGEAMTANRCVALTYDSSPHGSDPRGVLTALVVADQARRLTALDRANQEREVLDTLEEVYGPAARRPTALLMQDWQTEEWTKGCYASYFAPRVLTTWGHAIRRPRGRVHWAGTETSPEWNGYMEGALQSGIRVAAEMIKHEALEGRTG
jgi:monoamine oxidase